MSDPSKVTVILELDADLVKRINSIAQQMRPEPAKRISQLQWLRTSPAGIALWQRIAVRQEYNHLPVADINRMVRAAYMADAGAAKTGRPPIAAMRNQLVTEALNAYLKPQSEVLAA